MNEKIRNVLKQFDLHHHLNYKETIVLNEHIFQIPVHGETGLSHLKISEPWMISILKIALLIEEKLFIDVGVNLGQTLLKLKSVSGKIRYLGFEPNPECISYVKKLIRQNNFEDTELVPVGISDETKLAKLIFFSPSSTDSRASVISGFREHSPDNRTEYVPLFEFKDVMKQDDLENVSILKIDVEGGELEVLKSFFGSTENKPIILIEILPVYNDSNLFRLDRQLEIENLLNRFDYIMIRIIKGENKLVKLEPIKQIGIHSDLNACDYVMVPKAKKENFFLKCNSLLK